MQNCPVLIGDRWGRHQCRQLLLVTRLRRQAGCMYTTTADEYMFTLDDLDDPERCAADLAEPVRDIADMIARQAR